MKKIFCFGIFMLFLISWKSGNNIPKVDLFPEKNKKMSFWDEFVKNSFNTNHSGYLFKKKGICIHYYYGKWVDNKWIDTEKRYQEEQIDIKYIMYWKIKNDTLMYAFNKTFDKPYEKYKIVYISNKLFKVKQVYPIESKDTICYSFSKDQSIPKWAYN